MTEEELKEKIALHQKWLKNEPDGIRATFSKMDLDIADFRFSTDTNLQKALFTCSSLSFATFRKVCLRGADFSFADLRGAYFEDADLREANFEGANLFGVRLQGANLKGIKVNTNTQGYFLACPSEGAFTAFKKASHDYIVVLEVPADAKRSSATTYKCRCDKAKVLRIENLDGTPAGVNSVSSDYDPHFIYKVGETVSVNDFDDDRWHECSSGIHFFINRKLAVLYR